MAKTTKQIIAGALYAFAARLTMGKSMRVGVGDDAAPMADAVNAFCKETLGDDYGEPEVREWQACMKLLPPVVNDAIGRIRDTEIAAIVAKWGL